MTFDFEWKMNKYLDSKSYSLEGCLSRKLVLACEAEILNKIETSLKKLHVKK